MLSKVKTRSEISFPIQICARYISWAEATDSDSQGVVGRAEGGGEGCVF